VSTIYPVARAGAHPPIRYRLLVTSGFVALDLGRGRCGFLRTHGKYSRSAGRPLRDTGLFSSTSPGMPVA
jgi:hypothetical protein